MQQVLEMVRAAELDSLRQWFAPGARVLEIGGGNGFQAARLASWGCEIVSFDLPGAGPGLTKRFPVQEYDGRRLPVGDASADVVFSSSVLEHVPDLSALFLEIRRVLVPGGIAVHVVPTVSWRFWSAVGHYAHVVRRLVGLALGRPGPARKASGQALSGPAPGVLARVRAYIVPPAHGEFPTALSELYHYRRGCWRALFDRNGFDVVAERPSGIFGTGVYLLPSLSIESRRKLASVLGSTHVFVTRPR